MGDWDGVPLNPEDDGWHWVDECAHEWSAREQAWLDHEGDRVPAFTYMRRPYGGPCLTPAQVAAAVQAERKKTEADILGKCDGTYPHVIYMIVQNRGMARRIQKHRRQITRLLAQRKGHAAALAKARAEGMEAALLAVQHRMRGSPVGGGDGGTFTVRTLTTSDFDAIRAMLAAATSEPQP